MGKKLDWNNLPPAGTAVVFKGYVTGRHKHWGFEVGNTYYVGRGIWPPRNYDDEFIFELAEFTKSDLKDGMRLVARNGKLSWVCGSKVMFQDGDYNYLSSYTDSMLFNNVTKPCKFDIMKVTDRDGTVLFEREEEPRELTIEEIAKAFNLPVERVRIKK